MFSQASLPGKESSSLIQSQQAAFSANIRDTKEEVEALFRRMKRDADKQTL